MSWILVSRENSMLTERLLEHNNVSFFFLKLKMNYLMANDIKSLIYPR